MNDSTMVNSVPNIKGSDFILRSPRHSDIDDRLAIGKSREFVRMCGGDTRNMKPLTREQMEDWYKRICGREYDWIIDYKDKCIGGLKLTLDESGDSAKYAIGIFDETMLGKGIGTEATILILDYAFNKLKLNEIRLRVLEYNKRAISCYKKVGFKVTEILYDNDMIEDKWENDLIMTITKSEYLEL